MLPAKDAEQQILEFVHPLQFSSDSEAIALLDAVGRILAEPVVSQLDFPHWDNSAMDGYAVRYEDVQDCSADAPVVLEVIEEIPAGYLPKELVQPGTAARIFTGAIMPVGANTIVIQEEVAREGDHITITHAPQPQAFVRYRGSFYRAGEPLLPAGTRLRAPEIAILAAAQCQQVTVLRRLRVAILSTGDELVGIDQPLEPGQIVDSNQYALAALVQQMGAEPLLLGVVPDRPDALQAKVTEALECADVVLSSGGVSVGDYDYVEQVLAELGAEIHIRSVAVKPGKPLTVATFAALNHRLYVGLPGNPASALVTFWRFVQPALRKMAGWGEPWEPQFVTAKTRKELKSDGRRETYVWGTLRLVEGQYEFEGAGGNHSSGNLINLSQTTGLGVVPIDQTYVAAGERILVLPIGDS